MQGPFVKFTDRIFWLANLFGYTSDLRSATKGQASFSMEFSHYAPVPIELADLPKIVKK